MPKREDGPYRLREALAGFEARGITLPDSVIEAVAHWQAIKGRTPADQSPTALRDAIAAGADDAEIDRLLLLDLGSTKLKSAYTQAGIDAANRALAAVLDARAELHPQLATLAAEAIDKLEHVAALGESVTLDTLVRRGDTESAKLFADRQVVGAELHALYQLRDGFLYRGGLKAARVGHIDCTRWKDEAAVEGIKAATVVDGFIRGLRNGGTLWFPTAEEAVAAAQPLFAAWQKQAKREAAERKQQGGFVAFGGGF